MANIKVELKELGDAQWIDITKSCVDVSAKLRRGFGSLGDMCDVTKLTLQIKAENLESAVLFHSSAKQIRLSKDGVYVFEGYTEGNSTVDSTADTSLAWVTLNAFPYAQQFENAIAPSDLVFENCKICDPTDREHSLVHLFAAAIYDNLPEPYKTIMQGAAEDIETNVSILKVLPLAVIEEEESIADAFTSLLHEFGLVFYMTNLSMTIVEPYNDDPTRPVQMFAYDQFIAKPEIKTAPYIVAQRTEVTLSKVIERENGIVYELYEAGSVPTEGDKIEAGETYPTDGDLSVAYQTVEQEKNENLEFFYATGLSYSYLAQAAGGRESTLVVEKAELGATEALFKFRNANADYVYLNQLTVMSSAYYLRDTSTVVKDETVKGSKNVNRVESIYMVDIEDAEKYIQTYRAEVLAEKTTFTFSSGRISAPEPNTLIRIGDIPAIMLVRYTEEDITTGDVTIYAVAFDVLPIGTSSTVERPTISGGVSYLSLSLSGTAYSYNGSGELDPDDQLIKATLTRYGTADTVDWYINSELQDSHDLVINVPPSFMGDRSFISVRAVVGSLYAEQYIYKNSAGKDAPPIIWQYCYSDSDTIAPLGAGGLWYMLGMPLFYVDQIMGDMATEFWTDYKPDEPEGKPFLWVRWSNDGGVTWSEPICMTGRPATVFSVDPPVATYNMTSRSYVNITQGFNFTCKKQNIAESVPVAWSLSVDDEHLKITANGESCTLLINAGFDKANFNLLCTVEGYGTMTVPVRGTKSGEPKPEYQGVVRYPAELPATLQDGSDLMLGDHLLYIDANGTEIPKYWTGTEWADVTENTANFSQIMNNVLMDALAQEGTIPSQSVMYLYVGRVVGNAAVFEQLFAAFIELTGVIYGGAYKVDKETGEVSNPTGGIGFALSAIDGMLRATGAQLNGSFECKDDAGIILKTFFGQNGEVYEASPKTRWDSQEACAYVAVGGSGTCTYDGESYSYKRTNLDYTPSSSADINKAFIVYSSSGPWSTKSRTFTPPYKCKIMLEFQVNEGVLAGQNYAITYRGQRTAYNSGGLYHPTYEMEANESLLIEQGGARGGASVAVLLVDDALYVYTKKEWPEYRFANEYETNSKHLVVGSFDSDTHITLASLAGWVDGLSREGVVFSPLTKVWINDVQYTPEAGTFSGNNFILTTTEGVQFVFALSNSTEEFLSAQYYNISGTLTLAIEQRGIAVSNLYPAGNDVSLGQNSNPFLSAFLKNLFISESFTVTDGSVLFTGLPTSDHNLVSGQVYREDDQLKIVP